MLKPLSIKLFAVCFLAQAAISAAHNALNSTDLRMRVEVIFEVGDGGPIVPAILAMRMAIALLLTWLVYDRASKVAKWFVILLAIGRVVDIRDAWTGLMAANLNSIAWMIGLLLGVAAVAFLFVPQSRYWFANKRRSVGADVAAFD